MKGIVTKDGSNFMINTSGMGEDSTSHNLLSGGSRSIHAREVDRKYKRTKLNLYETVE